MHILQGSAAEHDPAGIKIYLDERQTRKSAGRRADEAKIRVFHGLPGDCVKTPEVVAEACFVGHIGVERVYVLNREQPIVINLIDGQTGNVDRGRQGQHLRRV